MAELRGYASYSNWYDMLQEHKAHLYTNKIGWCHLVLERVRRTSKVIMACGGSLLMALSTGRELEDMSSGGSLCVTVLEKTK